MSPRRHGIRPLLDAALSELSRSPFGLRVCGWARNGPSKEPIVKRAIDRRMCTSRLVVATLGVAAIAGGACDGDQGEGPVASSSSAVSAATPPPVWAPHSPFTKQRLKQLCANPENPNVSRPPDPAGYCDIEVRLTKTQFVTGQGVSEGKGEL